MKCVEEKIKWESVKIKKRKKDNKKTRVQEKVKMEGYKIRLEREARASSSLVQEAILRSLNFILRLMEATKEL